MAHVVADRVRETTTTTGTGTYTLAGAVTGFETFGSIGNSNTTYYCCTDGTDFEVGVGTYTSSGTTLARTTILQSSNSDSAVNWSSGTRQIFCTLPAEKSVVLDSSGDLTLTGDTYNIVWDKSASQLEFPNNAKLAFGNADDFTIHHDGSNSIIRDTTGHNLWVQTDGHIYLSKKNAAEYYAVFYDDAGVALYHDNSVKFETASDGISVTGDITAKTSDGAILKLQTSHTTVDDGDVLGAIEFSAPDEGSGSDGDARLLAASISAEADANFDDTENKTDLVIKLGKSEAAVERARFLHEGGLHLTGYDTDSNPDPSLSLRRDTASPADGDFIGSIYFYGKNSAGNFFTYGAILAVSNDVTDGTEDGKLIFRVGDAGNEAWSGYSNNLITLTPDTIAFDASSGTTFGGHDISSVGEISATSLDISGDVDVDGTLEADAITLDGTAITTTATLSTGISNNNVPKFTSGVADNDFLRVDGTAIEGRSASEVLSDIGGTTATDAANEATALAIALG